MSFVWTGCALADTRQHVSGSLFSCDKTCFSFFFIFFCTKNDYETKNLLFMWHVYYNSPVHIIFHYP